MAKQDTAQWARPIVVKFAAEKAGSAIMNFIEFNSPISHIDMKITDEGNWNVFRIIAIHSYVIDPERNRDGSFRMTSQFVTLIGANKSVFTDE